ncbi:ABC transporter ATP-binding protein [Parapusillimonas granuli]|uniref:ABC transporter ATP-binding protein n=1 Tax=Parapusillimonas granuli TaxID=380911 RepID=A0A853FV84_9BURK|nr:ABC transporter ATP-binding protein [Parapusillimonas granuli]MBB5213853.1 putative spermidine/putrescine transport system ATP-binding protein [Parapusillimonas granuli]MEB2398932.1 ABC transporter ATP-binding protein [Alcaligenaceae bacterium]NYT48688.1 ABC transporter ATP-binding protein [Parapusillimonas granuli]
MSYLVLNNLTKRYGAATVVDNLTLSIRRGQFIALLGPSGCGKTTTLQMVAGFVEPSEGSIVLDGKDLRNTPANKRGLGIVFQNYALFPHMTAAQNVAFGLEMQGVGKAECADRVAETLALVGLSHLADRYPARMSGGQQQRVALARALVIKPRVLLLDEPLSNLDAKLREEMQLELRSIQRTVGTTTILVTHDQSEALALSDCIVVMNQGRVEQIAEPYSAYEGPANEFVGNFLGKANIFKAQAANIDGSPAIRVAEAVVPLGGVAMPEGSVLVRPEKILFTDPGPHALPGTVKTRVFQGNHWLCQVRTSAGDVLVIRQNDGVEVPAEGAAVHLAWRAQDMRALGAAREARP